MPFFNNVFNTYNNFMVNLAFSRNPCLLYPALYCYQSMTLWQKCEQSHSLNSIQNILEVLTVFPIMLTLYRDHEKFSKSATRCSQAFLKALILLGVSKNFQGKFSTSVLFNDITFIAAIFLTVDELWLIKT